MAWLDRPELYCAMGYAGCFGHPVEARPPSSWGEFFIQRGSVFQWVGLELAVDSQNSLAF